MSGDGSCPGANIRLRADTGPWTSCEKVRRFFPGWCNHQGLFISVEVWEEWQEGSRNASERTREFCLKVSLQQRRCWIQQNRKPAEKNSCYASIMRFRMPCLERWVIILWLVLVKLLVWSDGLIAQHQGSKRPSWISDVPVPMTGMFLGELFFHFFLLVLKLN